LDLGIVGVWYLERKCYGGEDISDYFEDVEWENFLAVVGLSGSGAYSALTARVLADEMAVFCDNRKEKGDWR